MSSLDWALAALAGAIPLACLAAVWYYRREARVAVSDAAGAEQTAAADATLAADAQVRVQGLELARAKALVDTYAQALKDAANAKDPADVTARGNAALDRLRR